MERGIEVDNLGLVLSGFLWLIVFCFLGVGAYLVALWFGSPLVYIKLSLKGFVKRY